MQRPHAVRGRRLLVGPRRQQAAQHPHAALHGSPVHGSEALGIRRVQARRRRRRRRAVHLGAAALVGRGVAQLRRDQQLGCRRLAVHDGRMQRRAAQPAPVGARQAGAAAGARQRLQHSHVAPAGRLVQKVLLLQRSTHIAAPALQQPAHERRGAAVHRRRQHGTAGATRQAQAARLQRLQHRQLARCGQ